MLKISPCAFGGNQDCRKQGGNGARAHESGYTHPFPHTSELDSPSDRQVSKAMKPYYVEGIIGNFDEELSEMVLGLEITKSINEENMVRKSLYDFDLESEEGVNKLLELLIILDEDIVKEVYQEVFPGYPKEDLDVGMARKELRGYFMDYLANG